MNSMPDDSQNSDQTHPLPQAGDSADTAGTCPSTATPTVPLHVVLIHPEIPHNTGAVGRLCVGLNCELHLIRPLGFRLSAEAVRRAGLDYWDHLRLTVHDSWSAYLQDARPRRLFFASTRGCASLYACAFRPDDHLVFGSEGHGLPASFYAHYAEHLFRIPMPGAHARSINLANAVSIVTYEAYRQISGTAGAAPMPSTPQKSPIR